MDWFLVHDLGGLVIIAFQDLTGSRPRSELKCKSCICIESSMKELFEKSYIIGSAQVNIWNVNQALDSASFLVFCSSNLSMATCSSSVPPTAFMV